MVDLEGLNVFLVGGAVRDQLLGLQASERDWVVIGSSADEMRARGFRQVGTDFPVFLHPDTGEEYALARTERKAGHGYHGFVFDTDRSVTLEDDLLRRDLTVNAIAAAPDGTLIDPHGGADDLRERTLRHVSPAFREDPLRVLRTARFAARFAEQRFVIAAETMRLMTGMVDSGELDHLTPERVWMETRKALMTTRPSVYFQVLRVCGALPVVFPEIAALFGVPQRADWHPEVDTGLHTLMVIDMAARLSESLEVRFAALAHDLGKAETPTDVLPSHHGHEARSVRLTEALCDRLRIPNACRRLAVDVARCHGLVHRAFELRAKTILKLLNSTGALRDPDRFDRLLAACEADFRGRDGLQESAYPQRAYLAAAREVAATVTSDPFVEAGLQGRAIGEAMHRARLDALKSWQRGAAGDFAAS